MERMGKRKRGVCLRGGGEWVSFHGAQNRKKKEQGFSNVWRISEQMIKTSSSMLAAS